MQRTPKLLASVGLSVVAALSVVLFSWAPGTAPRKARAAARPNIVFILADDMRKGDLRFMPQTRQLLQMQGMSFNRAFVSDPLCTPSRSSTLRGEYPHNTGVMANLPANGGGYSTFVQNGNERDTMGTRMQAAGYRTGFFGKYMNGYNVTRVPPGWDRWFAHVGEPNYYNYDVSSNGTKVHYGSAPTDYEADVVRRQATTFIGNSAGQDAPFLAYVAPKAPHTPSIPAPRDAHAYDGIKAPHPASYNEKNIGDKPPWIRGLPPLSAADNRRINDRYELRAESLQAVDDLVAGIVAKLRSDGQLSDTYVFFTSDNGWHLGEHRIPNGKDRPYEEDQAMPLLVRGPGIAPGATTQKLALNNDYLPTFTALAGAAKPPYADGRSLLPVLHGTATNWRTGLLVEGAGDSSNTPEYHEFRSADGTVYTAYAGGQKELYHLRSDPQELNNAYDPNHPNQHLSARLSKLKSCAGASCISAENGP